MRDLFNSYMSTIICLFCLVSFARSADLFIYCKAEDPRFKVFRPVTLYAKVGKANEAKPTSQLPVELVSYGMPRSMREKMEPIYGKQIEGKKFKISGNFFLFESVGNVR